MLIFFFRYWVNECNDLYFLSLFQARNYVASMPKWPKKDFREVFLGANPNGEKLNFI